MNNDETKYWLEPVLDEIELKYPTGKITISSGISPSASYHIGHFREILSADFILLGLRNRGREAEHIHVVDNLDPLRKRYDFLPEDFERYVKWPVCLIPAPDNSNQSYADYFYNKFREVINTMKLDVTIVRSYEELYKAGKMTGQIETVLENLVTIKKIFKEVSNRDLDDEWTPVQVLGKDGKFVNAIASTWDKQAKTIDGIDYTSGKAKLNWRLDWPARWQVLGVDVEPHSFQELGAAGSAYETGIMFAEQVFKFDPPIPAIQYGMVHLPGDNLKMSSSKNNLVTPEQAFAIIPPVALRYYYARYPGRKRITFDPGIGLLKILDEFSAVDKAIRDGEKHEYEPAYRIATAYEESEPMSSVPFSHLVSVYQASLGDKQKALETLKRTDYKTAVQTEESQIESELNYVANWLEQWAPEQVKFELQETLPEVQLTNEQKKMLGDLANRIENHKGAITGSQYHELIYQSKEAVEVQPKEAFQAIYRVVLNKDFGPKAGWFLSILDKNWLINRFRLSS